MRIQDISLSLTKHAKCKALAKQVSSLTNDNPLYVEGLYGSAGATVFSGVSELLNDTKHTFLYILNDEDEAGYFYNDLSTILGSEKVLFFPSPYRRKIKYAQRDYANDILRTEVLSSLSVNSHNLHIITFPEAISVKVVSPKAVVTNTIHIKRGDVIDMSKLTNELLALGFVSTDYVYEPGNFAIRGSIIDIFSYSSEYPFRIDFFGDEVDSIRTFNVQTQLSLEKTDEIAIIPEMDNNKEEMVSLLDFLQDRCVVVAKNMEYVCDIISKTYEEGFSRQAIIANMENPDNQDIPNISVEHLIKGDDFKTKIATFPLVVIGNKPSKTKGISIKFDTSPQPIFHKNFEMLSQSLMAFQENGYSIYVLADSAKQHERLKCIFEEMNVPIKFVAVDHTIHSGFSDDTLKVCYFTDHQIFDRFHKYNLRSDKARTGKIAHTLKELNQFELGDYVVHTDHGIGQFAGLVTINNGGVQQEMMKLIYQAGSIVYVSIHSLSKVSKYRTHDDNATPPRLSKLGTGAWEKIKTATKKKIKDIAADLIKLYSQRLQQKGFAYTGDTYLQHELEASFLYEDTPDQLRVTSEVKADMESAHPMDRLICGDVGFGKTEIAIRAAFKAASDGKQVAVLVPTTILAYQHYKTFSERLKNFPVTVEYLSRARSAKKQKEICDKLKEGKIEIIIGTHKLLGKGVNFHDLGLLIIDEEQKFGVSTKEKLRQLKVNVDTLTMSATPIPRTLQFSLMGARDMSVLQTPPPNRYPIQTEIHTFSHEILADAVNFEMSRNGQVFIVSNRIAALSNIKNLINRYVPDARVCIGHGQMPPEQLEKIVLDFINYDYDVLVSTTIVENGIDIPNANTIIIDNAQHFGLSDLHQMRGRVGRGNKKAFCYLLAPPLHMLPSDSRKRLEAIENFSDLGSGIHIAMQDLDIRGAGNMLGAEQSGFIADLGYETYQKILSEAVNEVRMEETSSKSLPQKKNVDLSLFDNELMNANNGLEWRPFDSSLVSVDTDLPLFFDATFVPTDGERMSLYRELDSLTTDEQLVQFRDRLEDRFGKLPHEAEDLLKIGPLRRVASRLGMERIVLKNHTMTAYYISNLNSNFYQSSAFDLSINYMKDNFKTTSLAEVSGKRRMTIIHVYSVDEALNILNKIKG